RLLRTPPPDGVTFPVPSAKETVGQGTGAPVNAEPVDRLISHPFVQSDRPLILPDRLQGGDVRPIFPINPEGRLHQRLSHPQAAGAGNDGGPPVPGDPLAP